MSLSRAIKSLQAVGKAFTLGDEVGASRDALIYEAHLGSTAVQAFKYCPRRPDGMDTGTPDAFRADYLDGLERFVAVGDAWAEIESPNVARVTAVVRVQDDESAWILADGNGRLLKSVLDGGQGLSSAQIRRLARGLSLGLRALHTRSLHHLNLCPHAVLLPADADGDPAECRLTALAPDDRAFAKIFKSTRTLAEPGYYARETQDGSGTSQLGAATDIYGASAVLFRLMTGEVLADWRKAADYDQALQALDRLDAAAYPPAFTAAVKAGLADTYEQRDSIIASWHDAMEDALPHIAAEPAIQNLPVVVEHVVEASGADTSPPKPPQKPARKLPPAWVMISAAAAAVLLIGWLVLAQFHPARSYDLVLSGSSSVGEKLAPELVKAWLESRGYENVAIDKKEVTETKGGATETHPEFDIVGHPSSTMGSQKTYRVHIRAAGTGDGFESARASGAVDIVMASRQIKPKEAEDLASVGDFKSTSAEHVVSFDGIAVIVSRDNPVRQLTVKQIHDIFTGAVTDWGQAGGTPGRSIHLFSRDTHSGTYDGFKSKVLGSDKMAEAKMFSAGSELEAAVAADSDGIGFASMSSVNATRALAISVISGNYFVPNSVTVRTQVYPLYRRLYLYSAPQAAKPEIAAFLAFATSDEGQKIPQTVGQVSLSLVNPLPPPTPGEPEHTLGSCQLSSFWKDRDAYCRIRGNDPPKLVLTFGSNQSELDSLARDDIDRLNALANSGSGKTIVLVGHTDSQGDAEVNRRLSEKRADSIKELLTQQGWTVQTYGFGEDLPVAPNETDPGRQQNRRVEVFIR